MTPSDEVNDATGEGPARKDPQPSVFDVLTAKRKELHVEIRALAAAEANYDTDAAVKAQQKIDVLIGFIDTLARQHSAELNATAAEKAQAWVFERRKRLGGLGQRIGEAQDSVREALQILQAKIAAEAELRAEADELYLVEEVFAARFGFPFDPKTRVELPALEDYVQPVLVAVNLIRPSHHHGLVYCYQASDTPEVRLQKALKAVTTFVKQYGKTLPTEVRAILNDAPLPEAEERKVAKVVTSVTEDDAVIGMGKALSTALPSVPLSGGL